jgi:hypothetical protein
MYTVHPHHRNGNPHKSQWTINKGEEVVCFENARLYCWLIVDNGWGLHLIDKRPHCLGVGKDRHRRLFVAKFVGKLATDEWHGYPADHVINFRDIPPAPVLQSWLEKNLVRAAKIRKISKGQPCSL